MNRNEAYDLVHKSLVNFFTLDIGQVWTNPELGNPLEDLVFEDISEWSVQKMVESRLKSVLDRHFTKLKFDHQRTSFVIDTKKRSLHISLYATLDGYNFDKHEIEVKR